MLVGRRRKGQKKKGIETAGRKERLELTEGREELEDGMQGGIEGEGAKGAI